MRKRVVGDRVPNWQNHPWTSNWYKLQAWEKQPGKGFYDVVFDRRYGGDLVGVVQKLHYLKYLGVDVIYLNPIFEAPSLHKYDASTYHHVDNNFGMDREGDWKIIQKEGNADPETWSFSSADRVFLNLITKAHELGIRIVIDGVFNHCGTQFWAFREVQEKQQNSRYKDWFDITRWDDPSTPDVNEFDYKGWWGFKGMPEFREDEHGLVEPVRQYIFNITRRWMDPDGDGNPEDGIDGWRLDVAKDVSPAFWVEWNALVKSINPEAITVGEIWEGAGDWVKEKRLDAVMNYPLAYAMARFFINKKKRLSVSEFDRELARIRSLYPEQTNHILMNLIDSHDTDRVGSMIKNPDRHYDRKAGLRSNPEYDPTKPAEDDLRIQKLIAIFQMTYVGAPAIYYGDEVGMWGGDDPDDRKPMIWRDLSYESESYALLRPDITRKDAVTYNRQLFDHYRLLTKIRHDYAALRVGGVETLLVDDDKELYGFIRKDRKKSVLIVLNNGSATREADVAVVWEKGRMRDLLAKRDYKITDGRVKLKVEPKWAAVLVKK